MSVLASARREIWAPKMKFNAAQRVFIDQFFGRLKNLMHLAAVPYSLDKSFRQLDVDNMIFRTKHHVRQYALCASDGEHFRNWLCLVVNKELVKKRKLSVANRQWRRKLARLSSIGCAPEVPDQQDEQDSQGNDESFWQPL